LAQKVDAFESRRDWPLLRERMDAGWRHLDEFLKRYPLRQQPGKIEELTPRALYNPGPGNDYFFLWVTHRLQPLGGIRVFGDQPFRNASDQIDDFKRLMRIGIDDNKSLGDKLHPKVGPPWHQIKGFGGDMHIAKKIINSYYADETLPIVNTAHLEFFCQVLEVDLDAESRHKYGLHYADVTLKVGHKWELLTAALLARKEHHEALRKQDNVYFMYVLYFTSPAPLPNNRLCLDRYELAACKFPECRRR